MGDKESGSYDMQQMAGLELQPNGLYRDLATGEYYAIVSDQQQSAESNQPLEIVHEQIIRNTYTIHGHNPYGQLPVHIYSGNGYKGMKPVQESVHQIEQPESDYQFASEQNGSQKESFTECIFDGQPDFARGSAETPRSPRRVGKQIGSFIVGAILFAGISNGIFEARTAHNPVERKIWEEPIANSQNRIEDTQNKIQTFTTLRNMLP